MIRIENVKVYGLSESIKASKYPMAADVHNCTGEITCKTRSLGTCDTGTGHDQFLTGIIVQFDLTLPIKVWTEAERYHFLDFVSSQSTMHRIANMDIEQQCSEYVTPAIIAEVKRLVAEYKAAPTPDGYLRLLYNIPTGFCLTARMTTNYRQLKTIYHQRKNHRLPEWKDFCKWIETLPYFKEIVLDGVKMTVEKTAAKKKVKKRYWLIEARMAKWLSQEGLGRAVGASPQTISALETGERNPSLTLAKKLADVLGIDDISRFRE